MGENSIRLNPFPYCHRFAFTFIHDADSAYSKRLQPLINEFNTLQMPISVTVFTLWADWAENGEIWRQWNSKNTSSRYRSPIAVPLEDRIERSFYQKLASQGHEIAMHTASETSDTRQRVSYAFEFFKSTFNSYPRMYVEHSAGNKMDTQLNFGSQPSSEYYNTDLLNDIDCWTWLDYENSMCGSRENCHDILAARGTLFDHSAEQRFGIRKSFYRSGKLGIAGGNEFLLCYSHKNIDALVASRGVAMVYTHLNFDWLDLKTGMVREPIRERLAYLRGLNGWFTTGSNILDRFSAIENIDLVQSELRITLKNNCKDTLKSVSLIVDQHDLILKVHNQMLKPDNDGLVPLGDLKGKETLIISIE